MNTTKHLAALAIVFMYIAFTPSAFSQEGIAGTGIHGNFQFDGQYYFPDSVIGTPEVPEKFLNNGFANFNYERGNFMAGLRYESYLNPLLGFDPRYSGSGITYRFLAFNNDKLNVTVGNFYEQFGSGVTLRAYEERSLGIDNAIDGIRIKYTLVPGLTLKGLVGRQRNFFDLGEGLVRGFDGEMSINEVFKSLEEKKMKIIVGGSFVSKYQADEDPVYILPENVGNSAGRLNLQYGGWSFLTEYAYKINDPNSDNGFIYKSGQAFLSSLSYNKKGLGATAAFKRLDNMSFRSDRTANGNSLYINYLPANTKNHTYLLPAMYPYATQPNGEVALQAEVFFNLKQNSKLGGKYGTDININYSKVTDIQRTPAPGDEGYTSDFFAIGDEVFFEDFNMEINRKWNKSLRTILSYVYLDYNKDVIEGRDGFGHVYSSSVILETIWKITSKKTLRTELQALFTEQDKQDWYVILAEYTIAPKWSIAAFDQYNYGNEIKDQRFHYYTGTVVYTKDANRFSIGYGRQRAGIICIGGVCRNVPASNGLIFSVTSSF